VPRSRIQGWGLLYKQVSAIIQIVHPYTLDTSNPCWYDVGPSVLHLAEAYG